MYHLLYTMLIPSVLIFTYINITLKRDEKENAFVYTLDNSV